MESSIYKKNQPDWDYKEIIKEIETFSKVYENRPIKNNKGGMKFPHAFALYFILKKTKPSLVIESGIFKGQSTWLIENTLPEANIICIDIDLSKRVYISKKAKYSNSDFRFQNFSQIPENTLVLFDDHVNHLDRIKQAYFFGIKNVVLDDNYKSYSGDFQTIKQSFEKYSFNHQLTKISIIKTLFLFIKLLFKKIFINKFNSYKDLNIINDRIRDYNLNENEFINIDKIIDTYYEFPPIIPQKFNSEKALLDKVDDNLKKYLDELNVYNNFTFIKLK